jgi:hypothetical protein
LPEREYCMKHDKNLQFCMDVLESMQNRNGPQPEQKSAPSKAKAKLRKLRRDPNPTRREIFEVVREVAEVILDNFVDRSED